MLLNTLQCSDGLMQQSDGNLSVNSTKGETPSYISQYASGVVTYIKSCASNPSTLETEAGGSQV